MLIIKCSYKFYIVAVGNSWISSLGVKTTLITWISNLGVETILMISSPEILLDWCWWPKGYSRVEANLTWSWNEKIHTEQEDRSDVIKWQVVEKSRNQTNAWEVSHCFTIETTRFNGVLSINLTTGSLWGEIRCVVFVDFCGVNAPTMAYFKLPMWCHWA